MGNIGLGLEFAEKEGCEVCNRRTQIDVPMISEEEAERRRKILEMVERERAKLNSIAYNTATDPSIY